MPHFILIIISIVALYYIFTESWTRKLFLLLFLVVYLGVFSVLNTNVRKASWHGNTKHGWYSKYNSTEKLIATVWIIFFPVGTFVLYSFIFATRNEASEDTSKEQSKNISNIKTCPKCGNPMILRTARRGKHIGKKFWGCSRFPECREILT